MASRQPATEDTMPTTLAPAFTTPSLTPAELLYGEFAAEHHSTRRILERYPDGQGAWRPHEKSRTLAQLATHVATVINIGAIVLTTDVMEVGTRKPVEPVDSSRALLDLFNAGVERFDHVLANVDFETLARPWAVRAGGRTIVERPKREMLRIMMMGHTVHHRAQLGVYYRLLGVSVPGVYGPTADD